MGRYFSGLQTESLYISSLLHRERSCAILVPNMIEVTRKDSKESAENLVRRFNRRVQQSGLIIAVKQGQYFEKPISKRDRRAKAIIRNQRKALKLKKIKLGLK